ncbi:MAG: Do family serine endopeptidase [Opitutaceae bacterium]|nr:Do family serine endopeptidase [Opitutaceae bacterium]
MTAIAVLGARLRRLQERSAPLAEVETRPAVRASGWLLPFLACLLSQATFTTAVSAVERGRPREAEKPEISVDQEAVKNRPGAPVATYADVVEAAQKAVVSVNITKIITQRRPVNPLFDHFFGDRVPRERESREQGIGSGVIVSKNGYILTNNHVVEGADVLNVTLPDEREFTARVIGTDPQTDVAVIKIDAEDLPALTLADSDKMRVGDVVFAIGNPLGIGQTVTMGIVSALGRNNLGLLDREDQVGYENFIQTDAAINMGNSGGALIDAKGRLAGINTAIVSTTRGNIGIGFAIPINLASMVMHSLVETGSVSRGFLGVNVDPLTAGLAEAMGLSKDSRGVIVTQVEAGSPADKAGLRQGDAILSINGRTIASRQDLRLFISQFAPGTEVQVRTVRVDSKGRGRGSHQTKEMETAIKLGRRANEKGSNEILPGVTVEPVTDEVRERLTLEDRVKGIVVTEVAADSPFAEQFVPNVVILEINRVPVRDPDAAREAIVTGQNNLFLVYYRRAYRYLPVLVP